MARAPILYSDLYNKGGDPFEELTMLSRMWTPTPEPRPRGGVWQRLDAEAEQHRVHTPSRAACGQLQDWADGITSAVRVQMHMENTERDGLDHVMIHSLASIGSGQNAQRGIMRWLEDTVALSSFQTIVENPDLVQRTHSYNIVADYKRVCVCGGWVWR